MQADPRASKFPSRQRLDQARREVRLAAELALRAELEPPPKHLPLRRVAYGISLPFGVLRRVWRDPEARRAYLGVVVPQLALVAVVAFLLSLVWSKHDAKHAHGFAHVVALASLTVSILSAAEWVVIAFSREHHEHLSFRAAQMTGVPHDAPDGPPRVHLNMPWLWTKAKRKLRAFLVIAVGLPVFAVLELLPHGGHAAYAIVAVLWSAYWVAVFTLASTSLAWRPQATPRDPFFLRGLGHVAEVPVLGWFVRLYIRIARRVSSTYHHACQAFEEEAPYEAIGLALARFVLGLPGLYLVTRPVMPVAATHALLSRRPVDDATLRDDVLSPRETATLPADDAPRVT